MPSGARSASARTAAGARTSPAWRPWPSAPRTLDRIPVRPFTHQELR
jgi:hypothetical protein